jgi:histidyl-tRNA synthetase
MAKPRFQNPKGTRDLYPEELLRRRYITQVWRDTSIRHGFEEIDGPTFETADLYAVKSGDGILGELFQAFSGKSPEEVEQVQKEGRAPFALRPEFTPTLARMYAARAAQLPKPTKWFSIGPFFRAERPQRGRLREFLQWNADVMTDPDSSDPSSDADLLDLSANGLRGFGIDQTIARIHIYDRRWFTARAAFHGVREDAVPHILTLTDRREKMPREEFESQLRALGVADSWIASLSAGGGGTLPLAPAALAEFVGTPHGESQGAHLAMPLATALSETALVDNADWKSSLALFDSRIVRGLAYYTGTVFEVIAEGERAVAGGGRYDNLIELLGGPPTPAVGFAMGDVVLSLLLEDKDLMPEGQDLLEAVSRPGASLRPEAFVVTADEALDPEVRRLVATLRRGVPREAFDGAPWSSDRYETRPLHARRSYKSTRNIGKLIKDATGQHARTLVIIESAEHATLQHLDTKTKLENIPLDQVPAKVAELTR